EILHLDTFKRGKGKFIHNAFKETAEIVDHGKEFPYIITTVRELEHYNSGVMTRRTRNSRILKEDVLLINPEDARKNSIGDGELVTVESARGEIVIKAKISDEMKSGVMSTTFHFPEIMMNVITSSISDSEAKCPEYKVVACRIRKK
ncbi:MAG TPA: molybdopterin dinucleotide binding domain-containing protein, partial [Bacteroidia bacterium]|nr:molybdopterin dinucleotide binding domain-containing protein [Bacteroidia bacterium]